MLLTHHVFISSLSSLSSSQDVELPRRPRRPLTKRRPLARRWRWRLLLGALPQRKRRRRAHCSRRQHEHQDRLRHRRVWQHEPRGDSSRRLRHGVDRTEQPRRSLHSSRRRAGHHAFIYGVRRRHVRQPRPVPEPDRTDDGREEGQHQVFAAAPQAYRLNEPRVGRQDGHRHARREVRQGRCQGSVHHHRADGRPA